MAEDGDVLGEPPDASMRDSSDEDEESVSFNRKPSAVNDAMQRMNSTLGALPTTPTHARVAPSDGNSMLQRRSSQVRRLSDFQALQGLRLSTNEQRETPADMIPQTLMQSPERISDRRRSSAQELFRDEPVREPRQSVEKLPPTILENARAANGRNSDEESAAFTEELASEPAWARPGATDRVLPFHAPGPAGRQASVQGLFKKCAAASIASSAEITSMTESEDPRYPRTAGLAANAGGRRRRPSLERRPSCDVSRRMQGAAAAMAASLRAGQTTDDVHPLYKRGKNASKSPQLMRSGMLPPNPEQDAGGDSFTRLVRRSIACVSSKPRSTSTAVSSQRQGWRDEIAASFRRRTSCRPGQGRAPARRSRVDAGAGVQAAAGLPLYKQKRPSMIGKQLDMKTLVETNFILKRKERRRKEMEARRRAETKHDELIGRLLIRTTRDWRFVPKLADADEGSFDVKRGGMVVVMRPPAKARAKSTASHHSEESDFDDGRSAADSTGESVYSAGQHSFGGALSSLNGRSEAENPSVAEAAKRGSFCRAARLSIAGRATKKLGTAPSSASSLKDDGSDDGGVDVASWLLIAVLRLRTRGAASRQVLDACFGLATVFTAVVIPYDCAFPERTAKYADVWVLALRVLFGFDLLLGFVTTIDLFDHQVHALRKTARAYLRGWFALDLIAVFPFDVLSGWRPEIVRLLLCVKVAKLSLLCAPIGALGLRLVHMTNERRALLVMLQLLSLVLVASHWAACVWWFVQQAQLPSDIDSHGEYAEWMDEASDEERRGQLTWASEIGRQGFERRYQLSLSVALMLFGGNTNATLWSVTEQVVAAFIMLTGSMITALMVSQIGQVANTVLASQREYTHKMDVVSVAMDKLKLPTPLRARVEEYYAYLWSRHGTFDIRHQLTDELNRCLSSEMNIFFHRRLIAKAPIFADCSSEVIQAVVTQLVAEVYLQGDFVVRAGMPMTAMYFIAHGKCSILVDDRERVSVLHRIRTLRRTQYFGELTLICDEESNSPVHVLAETNVDLYALYRSSFDSIKRLFPELLAAMVRAIGHSKALSDSSHVATPEARRAFCSVGMQLAVHTEFPAKLVQAIVDAVQQETYAKDEVIIQKRQPAAGLFFILEGHCNVIVPSLTQNDPDFSEEGQDQPQEVVRVLRPGEFFGELSLANDTPVSASVVAAGTTSCHVLGVDDFELFKINFPEITSLLESAANRRHYIKLHPFLKPPAFFGGLGADLIAGMVELMDSCIYEEGECIFFTGSTPDALFCVAQGSVQALVTQKRHPKRNSGSSRHMTRAFCYDLFDIEADNPLRDSPFAHRRSSGEVSGNDKAFFASRDRRSSSDRGRTFTIGDSPRDGRSRLGSAQGSDVPQYRSRASSTDSIDMTHLTGSERVAKVFTEGDFFAHNAVLHMGAIAEATVRAVNRCELCVLSGRHFNSLKRSFPELTELLEQDHARSDFALCSFLSSGADLFSGASVDHALVQHVASFMQRQHAKEGKHLITLGTPSAGLFIVMRGECNCLIPDPSDPNMRKKVAVKMPGEHFGELSLLEPGELTKADVVAGSDDVEVVLLTPESYNAITRERDELQQLLLEKTPKYLVYNYFFKLKSFADASHETLQDLLKYIQRQKHAAGAVVQRNDAPCEATCFVFTGQLLATADRSAPGTLREGDHFGGEAFSGATPRQQVQAGTDVELFVLKAADGATFAAKHPSMRDALGAGVCVEDSNPEPSAAGAQEAAAGIPLKLGNGAALGNEANLAQHLSFLQTSLVSMSKEFSKRLGDLEKASREAEERRERRGNAQLSRLVTKMDAIEDLLDQGGGRAQGAAQGGKSFVSHARSRRVTFSAKP